MDIKIQNLKKIYNGIAIIYLFEILNLDIHYSNV